MHRSGYLLLILSLSGCAIMQPNKHSKFIEELNVPVVSLRSTIVAQLPVSQKSISSNGREIVTRDFCPKGDTFKEGECVNDRYHVEYTVLGDQQPYNIEVLVQHERRVLEADKFIWKAGIPDDRLTSQMVERLRKELTKRREDRNVIDDFRVY
jgi:hypothetical protein